MKTDEEKYLVASNGDHAHACISRGGEPLGTVTARVGLGYILLWENPSSGIEVDDERKRKAFGLHRP